MPIIALIIVGAAAGFLATRLMRIEADIPTTMLIGIVGALVGGFVFGLLQLKAAGMIGEIITSTVGAILFLFALNKISK